MKFQNFSLFFLQGKDVGHIWELGGGTFLSKLIEIPLTSATIRSVLTSWQLIACGLELLMIQYKDMWNDHILFLFSLPLAQEHGYYNCIRLVPSKWTVAHCGNSSFSGKKSLDSSEMVLFSNQTHQLYWPT